MSGTGFFSDKRLQAFAVSLLGKVSAFVETGTCEGDTAKWMAAQGLSVFTCETNKDRVHDLVDTLPIGVALYAMSSEKFVTHVSGIVGALPLFFLDAHWEEYWPLRDELLAISEHYKRAIIVVHDCKVPERENFWYCTGGGADQDGPICDWNYVRQGLHNKNTYRLFYPSYPDSTPGYLVLFQNCPPIGDLANMEEHRAVFQD